MIQEQIREKLKDAMRAKNELKLNVYRGIISAWSYEAMQKGKESLEDEDALAVIRRLSKQRKDSIEQFEKGGRSDLAEKEKSELSLLEELLPAQMSEDEIQKIVASKKSELGIGDKKDSGKLIAALMKDLKGKADGALVKKAVDSSFS